MALASAVRIMVPFVTFIFMVVVYDQQSLNIVMVSFLKVRFTLFTSPNPRDHCLMLSDLTIEGTRLVFSTFSLKKKKSQIVKSWVFGGSLVYFWKLESVG